LERSRGGETAIRPWATIDRQAIAAARGVFPSQARRQNAQADLKR
jgi:hypothetical protein